MSLDMMGTVDPNFAATPSGGITLVTPGEGGYTGPGGTWEQAAGTETTLTLVTIQQASMKTAEFLSDEGGTVKPSDLRVVYINDGTMLYPDEAGKFAQTLKFSDGQAERTWRVREADNRSWRNYCKAIVERYRGDG
jgi:hypothetical protein